MYRLSKKYLISYVILFCIFYFFIMGWKYIGGDELNWLETFLFMAGISSIYFVLHFIQKRRLNNK
ncbi:hypothetical protein GCM10008934_03520 [Virgibacillus salarius]